MVAALRWKARAACTSRKRSLGRYDVSSAMLVGQSGTAEAGEHHGVGAGRLEALRDGLHVRLDRRLVRRRGVHDAGLHRLHAEVVEDRGDLVVQHRLVPGVDEDRHLPVELAQLVVGAQRRFGEVGVGVHVIQGALACSSRSGFISPPCTAVSWSATGQSTASVRKNPTTMKTSSSSVSSMHSRWLGWWVDRREDAELRRGSAGR